MYIYIYLNKQKHMYVYIIYIDIHMQIHYTVLHFTLPDDTSEPLSEQVVRVGITPSEAIC